MSFFGTGGYIGVVIIAHLLAIPFVGFWLSAASLAGFLIIMGFALQGANDMYYQDGSRRPYHPQRNPRGPRRRR